MTCRPGRATRPAPSGRTCYQETTSSSTPSTTTYSACWYPNSPSREVAPRRELDRRQVFGAGNLPAVEFTAATARSKLAASWRRRSGQRRRPSPQPCRRSPGAGAPAPQQDSSQLERENPEARTRRGRDQDAISPAGLLTQSCSSQRALSRSSQIAGRPRASLEDRRAVPHPAAVGRAVPASRGTPNPLAIRTSTSYAITWRPWRISQTSLCDWPVASAIVRWVIPASDRSRYTVLISRPAKAARIAGVTNSSGSGSSSTKTDRNAPVYRP